MKKFLIFSLIFMFLLSGCNSTGFYTTNAISGEGVFNQEEEEYLVYFYMPTCSHCIDFKPTLEDYEEQENSLKLYKVNLSLPNEQNTWNKYNIEGTPTIFHIKKVNNKNEEINRFIGVQNIENIPTK